MLNILEKISASAPLAFADAFAVAASAGGHVMLMSTLVAMGVLVLLGWAVFRTGRPEPLSLIKAPGRPNSLGMVHMIVIMAFSSINLIVALINGKSSASPIDRAALANYITSSFFVFIVCLIVAARNFDHGIIRGLGLSMRRWLSDSGRAFAAFLAVFPLCLGLEALGRHFLPPMLLHRHDLLRFMSDQSQPLDLTLAIFIAVIVAPVCEEVLYRGLLQSAVKNVTGSTWKAILISSAFFAVIHLKIAADPTRPVGMEALAPLFVLAVALGYNYERTGRLWPSIMVHMLFNLAVTLVSVSAPSGAVS